MRRRSHRWLVRVGVAVAASGAAAAGLSCGDPVHNAEVAALGGEPEGESPGPLHRPGQPCLTCHGGQGPSSTVFVTAGTLYLNAYAAGTTPAPVNGGDIHLVDATGSMHDTLTNPAGNFYVTPDQWNPVFPLGALPTDSGMGPDDITVAPSLGSTNTTPMRTQIGRGGVYGSCAYCHFDPPGPSSPGHVYQE